MTWHGTASSVLSGMARYGAAPYSTARYCLAQLGTERDGTVVWHGTAWLRIVWYGSEWHSLVWHGTARLRMAQQGTSELSTMAQLGTARHRTAQYPWHGLARHGTARHRSGPPRLQGWQQGVAALLGAECRVQGTQPGTGLRGTRWGQCQHGCRAALGDTSEGHETLPVPQEQQGGRGARLVPH